MVSTPRKAGGSQLSVNQFPQIVSVGIQLASGERGSCTGTKIDKNRILTAAHCVFRPWKQVRYSNRRFSTLTDIERESDRVENVCVVGNREGYNHM